jgi:hypothetical protein
MVLSRTRAVASVRRTRCRDEANAVKKERLLSGPRGGKMATVDGIEGPAE